MTELEQTLIQLIRMRDIFVFVKDYFLFMVGYFDDEKTQHTSLPDEEKCLTE